MKKELVRWTSYWADLFAAKSSMINIFLSLKKMMKIEDRILEHSNAVLCTEEIKTVWDNRLNGELKKKIKIAP